MISPKSGSVPERRTNKALGDHVWSTFACKISYGVLTVVDVLLAMASLLVIPRRSANVAACAGNRPRTYHVLNIIIQQVSYTGRDDVPPTRAWAFSRIFAGFGLQVGDVDRVSIYGAWAELALCRQRY